MRYGLLIEWRAYYHRLPDEEELAMTFRLAAIQAAPVFLDQAGVDRQGLRADRQGRRDGRDDVRLRRDVAARLPALGACPDPVPPASSADGSLPRCGRHDPRPGDRPVVCRSASSRMRCHDRCCRARRIVGRHGLLHAAVHLRRTARSSASIARSSRPTPSERRGARAMPPGCARTSVRTRRSVA